jgi:hypothetical protein
MGTFAETANVDYRSSLADQRKQTSVFWEKNRQFSLIRLPCVYCADGVLSFVRLFTKKQTEVSRLQTD